MNKRFEPLVTGQKIGQWTLQHTYILKRVRYWRVKCSCGSYADVRDANLKRGFSTKCRMHKSRLLADLTPKKRSIIKGARAYLKKKYGMDAEWAHNLIEFAIVYSCLYAGERMVPAKPGKPIGPNNYKFVPITKVTIDCKEARDRAAKWLGQKAYEISKQRIYMFLKKKEAQ